MEILLCMGGVCQCERRERLIVKLEMSGRRGELARPTTKATSNETSTRAPSSSGWQSEREYLTEKRNQLLTRYQERYAPTGGHRWRAGVDLFKGLTFWLTGRMEGSSEEEIQRLVTRYGGEYHQYGMRTVTHVVASAIALGNQTWRKLTDLNGRERSYVVVTPQWVVDAARFGKLPDVHLYPPAGLEEKYAKELRKKETHEREKNRLGELLACNRKRPREQADSSLPVCDIVEVEPPEKRRTVAARSCEEMVFRAKSAEKMLSSIEACFGDSVKVADIRGRLEKYPRSKHDLEVEVVEVDNLESLHSFQEIILEWFGQGVIACTMYLRPSERGQLIRLAAPEAIVATVIDGPPAEHFGETEIARGILRIVTGEEPSGSWWEIAQFLRGLDKHRLCEGISRAVAFLLGSRRPDRAQSLIRAGREVLDVIGCDKLESFYTLAFKLSNGGIGPQSLR